MKIFTKIKSFFGGTAGGSFFWPSLTSNNRVSREQSLLEYQGVVYTVVSIIAENFAKIQLQAKLRNSTNAAPNINHELIKLMRRPNPAQSQFQFLELHETYMGLVGESFWYLSPGNRSRIPTRFDLLRPDLMYVAIDKNDPYGAVKGYVYHKPDGNKIPFEVDEIAHFKLPNPYDPHYGLGPLQAGYIYVQTEKYSSDFTANSILNSGRPSGILNFKGKVDSKEFDQLKRRFKQEYTGTKNTGKTMFINGADAIDYQKLGMELGEVALKDLKDMSRDDIMMMWKVSKTMLGISEGVTLNNAKESREVFSENVIQPKQFRFVDHVDTFLMPRFDDKSELSYVTDKQYTLKEKLEEWNSGHNKWLRTNDIIRERNEFFGSKVKEDKAGETFYVPLSLTPLDDSPPEPAQTPADKTKPGDPPAGDPEKDKKPKKTVADVIKKKLTPAIIEKYRIQHYKIQAKYADIFEKRMQQVFDSMENEILQRNAKAFDQWQFDQSNALALAIKLIKPVYEDEMKAEGSLAIEFVGDPETNFELTSRVNNYISQRLNRFMGDTSNDLAAQLAETIAEGVQAGESIVKLRARIQDVFETTKQRAERIARTETSAASNQAAIEAYRQSPVVTGKEFYAQPDACPYCASMNGKIVGIDESYFKIGESLELADGSKMKFNYDDIDHPPLHPNCECALLPVYLK